MQTDDLIQWLVVRGVPDKRIALFDADLGVSGTKRIDERTGLQELVEKIKQGKIRAVLVYQISRLFRDETGVQYNVFADVCKQHNCLLMTSDGMIFNFRNSMHLKCSVFWQKWLRSIFRSIFTYCMKQERERPEKDCMQGWELSQRTHCRLWRE